MYLKVNLKLLSFVAAQPSSQPPPHGQMTKKFNSLLAIKTRVKWFPRWRWSTCTSPKCFWKSVIHEPQMEPSSISTIDFKTISQAQQWMDTLPVLSIPAATCRLRNPLPPYSSFTCEQMRQNLCRIAKKSSDKRADPSCAALELLSCP